ncbi:hypothetical protein DPMN_031531 [Dreissena polymorpha]|uniref:Uncharacterized protein n=1 Tax=Dreissena polymorpha TaxID=45954 RepID=A0A9D4M2H9_DREPO|nr:hypothetical protein DPMN_031531 [Dreissena polymorpha]
MISFSDLKDETVHDVVLDGTPTYTVVDGGSKKGLRKLVSSERAAWDRYGKKEISTSELLNECCRLYGPVQMCTCVCLFASVND